MKMKIVLIRIVCLSLFFTLAAGGRGPDAKTPESVESQKEAVVTVSVDDKYGKRIASASGFIVDQEGVIATSCNLVAKWLESSENTITVGSAGGNSFPMKQLISNDCRNALALITIQGSDLSAVRLAKGHKPKEGEEVVVMGRTSGGNPTASEGRIKNVRSVDNIFQVTVPITPAGDGSPVFNRKGEVIGLSTLLHGKKQAQHIVIPSRNVSREFTLYKDLVKEVAALPSTPSAPPTVPLKKRDEVPGMPIQEKGEQEFLRGVSYEKSGMFEEAMSAYVQAVGINPNHMEAYVNLGLVCYRLGKYSKAVDAYKNAIRINPYTPSVYNKLGAAYVILGEYPLALDAFKQSIKIDPRSPETHFNLGVASILAGDMNGALEQYIVLKELDKQQAENLLKLIP